MTPTMEFGDFQRSRNEKKRRPKALGMVQEASRPSFRSPFRRPEPVQTRQGSNIKEELNLKWVLGGFSGVSKTDFECLFLILLNRSIGARENNAKVRILKNTCVFSVRLNTSHGEGQEQILQEPGLSSPQSSGHQETLL